MSDTNYECSLEKKCLQLIDDELKANLRAIDYKYQRYYIAMAGIALALASLFFGFFIGRH